MHASDLTRFSLSYLRPAALALERRAEAEPVLDRILRSVDACPECRRRPAGSGPRRFALSSAGAGEWPEVLVRLICSRSRDGPWQCTYEGDVKRKVLLLGDGSAAKTDLVRPLVYDEVADAARDILGAKVMTRHETVSVSDEGVDFHVVFSVWDIAGHRFSEKKRMRAYFRGAKAVLAVCDLSKEGSVQELGYWLSVANRVLGKVTTVIVAKGREAPDPLPISEARIHELTRAHRATLVILPPKDVHLVEHVFQSLGDETINDVFGTKWRARMYA